jgi:hypothetical protein
VLWFDGLYTPRHEFSDHLRIAGAKVFADRAAPAKMLLTVAPQRRSRLPG